MDNAIAGGKIDIAGVFKAWRANLVRNDLST